MKIGIIGFGFVGKAVYTGLTKKLGKVIKPWVYDPFIGWKNIIDWTYKNGLCDPVLTKTLDPLTRCEYIFICVPTPTNFETGQQDASIVENIVACLNVTDGTIVIKSTVKPGTTQRLIQENPQTNIVFNPEFLTERNFITDFLNQDRIVIGGHLDPANKLKDLYKLGWPNADYDIMSATPAELVKYTANAFLSTKVAFFNEIYQLAVAFGADYDTIVRAVSRDRRIGYWGTMVPGYDGDFGFGGKCFPKDIVTLISLYFDKIGTEPNTISGAWHTNLSVRKDQDWKDIKGATTENPYERENERSS